ncbi:MAG: hypothetical protein COW01_15230 [Bdellovibrionales bacterium CG12_big_fil_rev_8_21_14_0_65_38_15]|nr:MAG: hypothetical protein COW79_15540 [Bdellovibrionales bacterium CG22_combo_CG10-13_8_21_14_all_38_13]PIQ52715.1 MAG: hypothetical protein COW01_15230 [Bdellovibrionales bacterium CG12_big_fil_rev_8_21_14_0_65_38_15]PIR31081.1 MAG: hypothetical protein COV38_02325 [Bdellovibrionales bacterium CG11_big_fil_rev_8_21_14_0_20_38_13]
MRLITHFLITLALLQVSLASDILNQFDQDQYSPSKYGLKDLVFEIRIDGIEKDLKERFALNKLDDPRYKVYWLYPGRIEIDVLGLPPGFLSLKQELKKLVFERIEYVVPQDLSSRLRGYRFDDKKLKNNLTQLTGKDETNTKPISQIELVLAPGGIIKYLKTYSPSGSQLAKFSISKKSWSHNKNVVDKVEVVGVTGIQKNTTETEISYISKDGFGFPGEIRTLSTIEAMTNTNNSTKSESKARLVLSNYEVNTGISQKYFMGLDEGN